MANPFTDTPDYSESFEPKDIEDNKVISLFSYLSWLVLIPIFAAKDSKYARFHANQGIVLAIIEIAVWVVFGILSVIPVVGWIFTVLNSLCSIAFTVFAVLGIVNAVRGKAKELPFIGGIRILK
ncbi:MAG: hypothetical protein ILO42_01225 [Clostridia bacterium]|nr:hypothetical protein [Clostridia bacterium]MBP5269560.1 hypothetical protein [Clostridia bacterium]